MPKTATPRPLSDAERAKKRKEALAILDYQNRALTQGKALWDAGKGIVNEGLASLVAGAEYAGDRKVTKDVPKDINRLGKMVVQNAGGYADMGNSLWQMVKGDGKQAVPDYYRNKAGQAYQEQFNPSPADPRLERFGQFYADPLAVGLGSGRAARGLADKKLWSTIAEEMARGTRSNIFAGIKAKNAPVDALEQGAKLLDEGADPRKVWADLGVFRGADGKMRWEIDDSGMRFNESMLYPDGKGMSAFGRAPDIVRHDSLFDSYPEMAKGFIGADVVLDAPTGGHIMRGGDIQAYSNTPAEIRSVLGHELQHGVQSAEGFPPGGTLKPSGETADQMGDYLRLSGEAEARLSASRLNMDDAARRAQYPLDPEYFRQATGVPLDELVYRYGDKGDITVTAPQPGLLGKMVAPQDEALRVAQANAAKPVSEGGLGLRPDNTPEERAAAMGFDTPAFHGTRSVFDTFDPSKATASRQGSGTWFSTNPEIANTYAGNGGSVIPALINRARFGEIDTAGANWQKIPSDTVIRHANDTDSQLSEYIDSVFDDYGDTNLAANISRRSGDKGLVVYNSNDRGGYGGGVDFDNLPDSADNITVFDPRYVRSRFAAFDPMRRDSTDMLAGVAPLGLIPWLPQDER